MSTLLSLSKLITDNLHILTSAVVLRNALAEDEGGRNEGGEKDERGTAESDASPSLELLSKAMELLLQAEEYANGLMEATVVITLSIFLFTFLGPLRLFSPRLFAS